MNHPFDPSPDRKKFPNMAPHCDEKILHAPGECIYCDDYPDWQRLRKVWNINFTGHNDIEKTICPAEQRRSLEIINKWGGNRPRIK